MSTTRQDSEAKAHLSEPLVRVEAGEDVIISRRNDTSVRQSRKCVQPVAGAQPSSR
jgi:hypothetical protein